MITPLLTLGFILQNPTPQNPAPQNPGATDQQQAIKKADLELARKAYEKSIKEFQKASTDLLVAYPPYLEALKVKKAAEAVANRGNNNETAQISANKRLDAASKNAAELESKVNEFKKASFNIRQKMIDFKLAELQMLPLGNIELRKLTNALAIKQFDNKVCLWLYSNKIYFSSDKESEKRLKELNEEIKALQEKIDIYKKNGVK